MCMYIATIMSGTFILLYTTGFRLSGLQVMHSRERPKVLGSIVGRECALLYSPVVVGFHWLPNLDSFVISITFNNLYNPVVTIKLFEFPYL